MSAELLEREEDLARIEELLDAALQGRGSLLLVSGSAGIGKATFAFRFARFLFAEGAERLKACLKAWDFLVPPNRDRIVLGRNAHGAILVLHDANDAEKRSVHVLDPFRVLYWTHSDVTLTNLIGTFLPERLIPNFVDDSLYAQWRAANEARLRDDEILAPRKPLGLGGKFDLDNFQREKIVSYYKTTAPIYRKAFAKMGRAAPSSKRRRRK